MGLRTTLVLLLVVAGLAALLHFGGRGEGGPVTLTDHALEGRPLLEAKRLKIRSTAEGRTLVFERTGGTFEMVEPVRDLASQARLLDMAAAWDTELIRVHEADTVDAELLRQTGLAAPRGQLVAEFDDKVITVDLGEDGVMGTELFVRRDGTIYNGSKALYSAIQGNTDDLRERQVFRNSPSTLKRLVVVHRKGEADASRYVIEKRGRALWLVEPIESRTSYSVASNLVAGIVGMTVRMFVAGNVGPQPAHDYELEVMGDAGHETVKLWRKGEDALLGVHEPRGLSFMVRGSEYTRAFEVAYDRLRSTLLNPFPPDEVVRITLDPGREGRKAAVLRRGVGQLLELRQPVESKTNPTVVAKLVESLSKLLVHEFVPVPVDLTAVGLEDGAFKVAITGPMRAAPVVILLGNDDGELTYARRVDEPHVVKVPKSSADALRQSWVRFVQLQVHRAPSVTQIQRVRYSRGAASRTYTKNAAGEWSAEGAAPEVDLEEIVEELADLRAAEVLDPATVGTLEGEITVELQSDNGMELARFAFFPRPDGMLVRKPRLDVVYRLRPRISQTLLLPAPK